MSRLRENVNRRSVLKAGALVVAFSLAGAKVVSARVLVRDGADGDAPIGDSPIMDSPIMDSTAFG